MMKEDEKIISSDEISANSPNSAVVEENAKLKEQILRLAADFENFRKRSAKEIEESNKFGITKFARDLIEVLENLYRAESSINTEQLESNSVLKNIFSGVELTKKSLIDILERYGIKRIEPLGEQFNHDFHQAITQIPSTTHKDGEIIQVIQAGYVIHGRILRPSLVAVAKAE
jgi:molecular chaperone GrpE